MIDFLIKSTTCLAAFLVFYHLILEREKMHQFNRFYLLISIVISLVIPFITFQIIKIIPVVQTIEPEIINAIHLPTGENVIQEKTNYIPYIIWSCYGLVSLILLVRFIKNIWKLISKTKTNPIVKFKNANLILINDKTLPHTFLNFIFINFEDYNNRNIEEELYSHELVHVNQKHTLDVLFIEILKVVFWFNPLFLFYKKAIQLNHEFLADEEIVKTYNNVPFYQNLLLQKSSGNQTIYLASNLNYLITKKRLIMMTKNTSQKTALFKKTSIIPILAGLIYFFCIEVVAQEKIETTTISQKNYTPNEKDKIRDNYYRGVWVKIIDKNTNKKSTTLYENLSLKDRRKYLNYIPKMIIENEVPEALFENMKTKNMAVWINGNVRTKDEIKQYQRSDFSYYTSSFINKNARSKRFPQQYQYSLYTKKYFDENLKNSHLHFKGDTIKIVSTNYKSAMKSLIARKIKSDTIVWTTEGKEGYNLYVNNPAKKDTIENNAIKNIEKKSKSGYISLNNQTYFYVEDESNLTEYYDRWGNLIEDKTLIDELSKVNRYSNVDDLKKVKKINPNTNKEMAENEFGLSYNKYLFKKENGKFYENNIEINILEKFTKEGYLYKNNHTYFYVKEGNKITIYNRWGKIDETETKFFN